MDNDNEKLLQPSGEWASKPEECLPYPSGWHRLKKQCWSPGCLDRAKSMPGEALL